MTCITISDGTGTGRQAKVDSENKLETSSITTNLFTHTSEIKGQSYLVVSDFISLTTTGSFNGILYIKNTSTTQNLHIQSIRTCSTETASVQQRLIKNPTTGTLISDANAGGKVNANFSSNNIFPGNVYAASGDGKTVTDGTNFTQFINRSPGHSIQEYTGAIVLGPSDSIALTAKPSAATTFCAEIQVYMTPIL